MGMRGGGEGIKFLRLHLNDAEGPCVIWPLYRDANTGYGRIGFDGRAIYAHRFMCELAHGAAPTPKHQAAHSCGHGHLGCVHPKHLRWMTNQENQMDRAKHGTWRPKGYRYKLTPEIAAEIRTLGEKETKTAIAQRFGTSRTTVAKILDGRAWPTPGQYTKPGMKAGDPRHPSLRSRGIKKDKGLSDLARKIIDRFDGDRSLTLHQIADGTASSPGYVWKVLQRNGRTLARTLSEGEKS